MSETSRSGRKRRANGDESRERILDAATEIAAMRGYEGTSIGAVSKLSGLPASSIYWHFADKDDLIAAVIERSYGTWVVAATSPVAATGDGYVHAMAQQAMKGLQDAPDFLRLGLMLTLERRPDEPKARTMFLKVRDGARALMRENLHREYPGLEQAQVRQLADFALATADGLFVAGEAAGDGIDLVAQFELLADAVTALAETLRRRNSRSADSPTTGIDGTS